MLKLAKKLFLLFFISFLTTFCYGHENFKRYAGDKTNIQVNTEDKTINLHIQDEDWIRRNFILEDTDVSIPESFKEKKHRTALEAIPKPRLGPKVAYLSFDDGPSNNTVKILTTLKNYDIKATFFVNGRDGKQYEDILHRIIAEGHVLGNHTYSHNYSYIYSSIDNYFKDYDKLNSQLTNIVGVTPEVMRFPGGSNNQVSWSYSGRGFMKQKLIPAVLDKGYVYFDWNVSCGDADGGLPSKETLVNNVKKTLGNRNDAVVLCHDSSGAVNTPLALPEIIEYIRSQGYLFDTLHKDSPPCRFQ